MHGKAGAMMDSVVHASQDLAVLLANLSGDDA